MANTFETAIVLVLRYRGGIDGNVDGLEAGGCEFVEQLVKEPAISNDGRTHVSCHGHRDHVSKTWVEKRFAARKADITNMARVQDIKGGGKPPSVDPAQVAAWHLAGVRSCKSHSSHCRSSLPNVAKRRAATADYPRHVPCLREATFHGLCAFMSYRPPIHSRLSQTALSDMKFRMPRSAKTSFACLILRQTSGNCDVDNIFRFLESDAMSLLRVEASTANPQESHLALQILVIANCR